MNNQAITKATTQNTISNANELFEVLGKATQDNNNFGFKKYRLEGFCFTFDVGINFYFDDLENFKDVIDENDLEIEFWQLEEVATTNSYDVDNFSDLSAIIEWLDDGEDEDLIAQYIALANDNFCQLDEAKEYHENNLFCEVMSDEDLGYYIVDEGLFGVEIPDSLANYLDYKSIGRDFSFDLSQCGDYYYMN